jgi:putative hydrolase of the HAD superfamily
VPETTTAGRRIDAVVFDYGGVFTPSPFAAAHAYADAQGVEREHLIETVFGEYHLDSDHAWHRLERGELSFPDALAEIGREADARGFRFDAGEMFGSMLDDGVDRAVVPDAVRSLRARGIRTAILTNNIREYGDHWRERVGADELFDLVVDSCQEGLRKPDAAIYLVTLERLGISDPARAVFLDDFAANVEAARAVGMHGIVVGPDPRPALAELEELVSGDARDFSAR